METIKMKKLLVTVSLLAMFLAVQTAAAQDQTQPENPFKALLERAKQMQKQQGQSSASSAVNPFKPKSSALPAQPAKQIFDMDKLKSAVTQMEPRVSDLILLENQINVMLTTAMPADIQNCDHRLIMQKMKDNTEKIVLLYQYELFLLNMITHGDIGVNHVFGITQKLEDNQLNIDEIYLADIKTTTAEIAAPEVVDTVAKLDRLVEQLRESVNQVLNVMDPVGG